MILNNKTKKIDSKALSLKHDLELNSTKFWHLKLFVIINNYSLSVVSTLVL